MHCQLAPAGPVPRSAARAEARTGWRFLLRSIGRNWPVLGASFGAALCWTAIVVAVPELIGAAVNVGIVGHDEGRLLVFAAGIAVLGLLQAASSSLRRWTNGLASRRLEAELRQRFFAKLLRLEVAYHDEVNRGQLLSRLTSDLFQIQAFVSSTPAWTANVVVVVVVAVVLLLTNPLLAGVTLVGLPFVAFASKQFSSAVRPTISRLQAERGNLAGIVEEAVSGVRTVKGFGSEALLDSRLGAQADAVRDEAMRIVRLRTRFIPVVATVPLLGLVALNWLGGALVLEHHLSVGGLLAFNAYVGVITPPVQSIGGYIVLGQRAVVSARRLRSVLQRTPAIGEPREAEPLPPGLGSLAFEQVRFGYRGAAPIFKALDLAITGGEVVALVGPTGSGKSTLLSLVARLYDCDAGTVRLDGADLRRLSLKALRASIAVVFEDNFLFDDSVRANLSLGHDVTDAQLRRALELSRASEFVDSLPEGLDTEIGERGLTLSGGQRQRLALARALVAEPRVLMLDDATSAVDAANEQAIVSALARERRGRTTLIVSHRPATIAAAGRVVLLDAGAVVAAGTHEELLASCPRYGEVLALASTSLASTSGASTSAASRPSAAHSPGPAATNCCAGANCCAGTNSAAGSEGSRC